ncbi:YjdF family protein [Clostridium massiliodielmoense]|uniref:YjdF family protein n=1 Tax=Clostridium massiliodielmoense TaxID=1776385 RepID=UPI0004D434C7|nr:YjdF family protein [Clostridium massiliodielmoense]KEH92994.1 hypothetical protein Z962_11255 [Clostridium botulinum C/D str. BKT12695]
MKTNIKLTVCFNGMFWVGLFERVYDDQYEISKVTFGSEPKDYDIYNFILKNFYTLKFSNSIPFNEVKKSSTKKINPKRLQRQIKKETIEKGIGTKAQNAIKLQYEEHKLQKKKTSKEKKELETQRKFQLKQEKKQKKHKGH